MARSFFYPAKGMICSCAKDRSRENWSAIWATDTIAVAKQAMSNVTYTKIGPRKWTICFSDRAAYLQSADAIKRQQLAKAGARLAEILNHIWP